MANTIMPPSGSAMGIDTPMRFVFTYFPSGPGNKDIPILFSSTDPKVQFDPPQDKNNPQITSSSNGEAVVTVVYKDVTVGTTVDINVTSPDGLTSYESASYTTSYVKTGNLVLSPNAVKIAPTDADLGTPAYTATATVLFTGIGGAALKNYPVVFQIDANVHVYDDQGVEQQAGPNFTYNFYTGPNGEPATFKVSSEFEGVYSCLVQWGSQYTSANNQICFLPELIGGPAPPFDLWSPMDLDEFSGPFVQAAITGDIDPNIPPTQPVIAMVNGKLGSDFLPYESLKKGVKIQKQVFTGSNSYLVNWMTTDTVSGTTTQSSTVNLAISGDPYLHPPTDGELAKPYVLGIGIINIPLLLKGDVTLYVPGLATGDQITVVYFLNGWAPGNQVPPETKAAAISLQYTATQDGDNRVMIPANKLGGYAVNGTQRGTFEVYYYKGFGNPGDKTTYSQPLTPIIPLVTA
jgi:hypothetical protein